MSEFEDKILDNMKYKQILKDNVISNPWLFNYEHEPIKFEGSGDKTGTVYTHTYGVDDGVMVVPSIMYNEESGKLEHHKDAWGESTKRGYGIHFPTEEEGNKFAEWLHNYHEISGKNKENYEL
tara:strand:- start:80 stop:448 length:369 start_codon:yes stop_codon:yes gene_type:complete